MSDKEIIKDIEKELADKGISVSHFYKELSNLLKNAKTKGDEKMVDIICKFMSAIQVYLSKKPKERAGLRFFQKTQKSADQSSKLQFSPLC